MEVSDNSKRHTSEQFSSSIMAITRYFWQDERDISFVQG